MGRFEVFLCFWEVLAPFSGMVACTELFPVPCTELFPVPCTGTELSAVHRAFSSAQSFVLAAFATLVCQRNCVFLCKGTKLKIVMPAFRCAQSFLPCTGTELWGPKPVIPDQRFCRWKLLFYQQPCAKAKEFVFRRILGQYAGILWRDLVLAFGKARQTLLFAK